MNQLMQANLQIIELLGAVFEEVERRGGRAVPLGHTRLPRARTCVGRPLPGRGIPSKVAKAMN